MEYEIKPESVAKIRALIESLDDLHLGVALGKTLMLRNDKRTLNDAIDVMQQMGATDMNADRAVQYNEMTLNLLMTEINKRIGSVQ